MLIFKSFGLIMTLGALLVKLSSSMVVPSPTFIEAFASEFQSEGVIFTLPDDYSKNSFLLGQVKHFR